MTTGDTARRAASPAGLVLAAAMAVNAAIQVLWISYAPVAEASARYYGVSTGAVGWFAMAFMVAFIPLSLPASWLIDARGVPFALGLASALMGVAGVARGLAGDSFVGAMTATAVLAAAQPLFLNSWVSIAARWFRPERRATVVSLLTLANLAGTGVGLALTPELAERHSVGAVQTGYGVAALACAALFLGVVRRAPDRVGERALVLDGIRHALRVRPFLVYLGAIFLGMGVFNGVTTWIEAIVKPRGFTSHDAGFLGLVMLVGGLTGAVLLSALSDRTGRRIPFLVAGLALAAPGLLALALAGSAALVYAGAGLLGFFLTSAFPIGMQYSAEMARPTPEATVSGLIQLAAQGSFVVVLAMNAVGSFPLALGVAAGLLVAAAAVVALQPEPRD